MSNIQQKSHTKLLTIIVITVLLLFSFVAYFGVIKPRQSMRDSAANIKVNGVILPEGKAVSEFQLTDNTGKTFTKANLQGHWTLLFFGFTNCAMVCPTTMAALNDMYKALQQQLPDNKLPQVVLVSVDPDRDTVERLNEYVTSFNPHFIGTRTDAEKTEALKKQFHIAAVKLQADGKGKDHYTVNHTAEILVINPKGELQAYLSYPHTADQLVKDYKSLLLTQTL
ncbi:MAG: SCO family protein [Gammaproteobacteria bacterium]